ncbi:MAG TPA: hypothetical protein VMC80_01485 [Patescibacteria group bacterium]|nr:hypothetical protein [Patescibacteria group bacterium]
MTELLFQVIIIAYALVGIVEIIGYIPTIKDLWYKKKKSANVNSYFIWTGCSVVSFLYSMFILPDLLFRIVSGITLICCAVILFLSLILKIKK